MDIKSVCVCGAGTMGLGIAQVAAASGFPVTVYELNQAVLEKAKLQLQNNLDQAVQKGKMQAEERQGVVEKISFTSSLEAARADLIIEAIIENADTKSILFRNLEQINAKETIICSNTSSLSINRLAQTFEHRERFAGLHFFNPAALMKLVEVIKGADTSEPVLRQLLAFTRSLGKTPVVCQDAPGFIVNRVARPFYIESLRLLEEGLCTHAVADRLLEARGFRLGPFRLMDLIGNDVNYAVSCSVYEQLGKPGRLQPSPLQQQKVKAGALGRKTGKGYYEY
jgi:3-hydroxybutyryl-CoA dehydrogenase